MMLVTYTANGPHLPEKWQGQTLCKATHCTGCRPGLIGMHALIEVLAANPNPGSPVLLAL